MNTRRKGRRTELKAKQFYEEKGYEVELVRYDKWKKQKDYFGLWDLICVGSNDIVFVQVKTNRKPNKAWIEKAIVWGPNGKATVIKEYVVYVDYQRGVTPSARVTL